MLRLPLYVFDHGHTYVNCFFFSNPDLQSLGCGGRRKEEQGGEGKGVFFGHEEIEHRAEGKKKKMMISRDGEGSLLHCYFATVQCCRTRADIWGVVETLRWRKWLYMLEKGRV